MSLERDYGFYLENVYSHKTTYNYLITCKGFDRAISHSGIDRSNQHFMFEFTILSKLKVYVNSSYEIYNLI